MFIKLMTVIIIVVISVRPSQGISIGLDNVHNLVELELIYQSETFETSPTDIVFKPDVPIVAFIDGTSPIGNGEIFFYDLTNSEFTESTGNFPPATRLVFTNDASRLLTGNRQGMIQIFDLETNEVLEAFYANDEVIEAIDISDDGQYIITASTNSIGGEGSYALGLFKSNGDVIFQKDLSLGDGSAATFINGVTQIAYLTISDNNEGVVRIIKGDTGEQFSSCPNAKRIRDLISYSDGQFLLYIAYDGIRKWDLRDCETYQDAWSILAEVADNEFIHAMVLHPSETILAVGGTKSLESSSIGFIRLFDVATGELLKLIEIPFTENMNDYPIIYTLAFSPDGTLLASGGQDGTVRLWGIPTGE